VRLPHSAVAAHPQAPRELQDAERAKSNGSWQIRGLAFPKALGGYAVYTNLVPRHFKPLLKRSGLPSIRFQDLRHTCATLLFTRGVHPKVVSEVLGHSSVSSTLDVYSHMIPELGETRRL
jgi:integrase